MTIVGTCPGMDDLHISRDDSGLVRVNEEYATSLLGLLITDDLGDDTDDINEVLAAIDAICTGSSVRYECAWNATRLVIEPAGARLTWSMNADDNTPELVSLDTLSAALKQLRQVVAPS